jgi:transcription elongation factor Elf1
MKDLRPCPFCGNQQEKEFGVEFEINEEGRGVIFCWNCPVVFENNGTMTDEDLIKAWNKRVIKKFFTTQNCGEND